MNVVNIITPYPYAGMWVFDDESRGLVAEPFVFGMSEILDKITQNVLEMKERKPFKLIFSTEQLPMIHATLEKIDKPDIAGCWYKYKDMEGWLCPATLLYYEEYPEKIHVFVESL